MGSCIQFNDRGVQVTPKGYVRVPCATKGCTSALDIDAASAKLPPRERDKSSRRCAECNAARLRRQRDAGKAAALTKLATGTNFVSVEWHGKHNGGALPAWLAKQHAVYQRILVKDGVVHDVRRVPVVLVDRNTLRIQSWVELEQLKTIWKRMSRDKSGAQRTLGFSDLVLAPQDCTETGELPSLEVT